MDFRLVRSIDDASRRTPCRNRFWIRPVSDTDSSPCLNLNDLMSNVPEPVAISTGLGATQVRSPKRNSTVFSTVC